MDLSGKEAYEARRREREERRAAARGAESSRPRPGRGRGGLIAALVGLFLLALFGWWLFSQVPKTEDRSVAYEIQGQEHVAPGSGHPPYNSNPPSSGWHYPEPAAAGFYERELPDEQVVHNLEHGQIWIAYRPGIPDEAKRSLRGFAGGWVVVSPRPANDADIALVAWGRVDAWNLGGGELDEARIRDFITRYRNKGPEKLPPGAMR